jgi:hypothetical protein
LSRLVDKIIFALGRNVAVPIVPILSVREPLRSFFGWFRVVAVSAQRGMFAVKVWRGTFELKVVFAIVGYAA